MHRVGENGQLKEHSMQTHSSSCGLMRICVAHVYCRFVPGCSHYPALSHRRIRAARF